MTTIHLALGLAMIASTIGAGVQIDEPAEPTPSPTGVLQHGGDAFLPLTVLAPTSVVLGESIPLTIQVQSAQSIHYWIKAVNGTTEILLRDNQWNPASDLSISILETEIPTEELEIHVEEIGPDEPLHNYRRLYLVEAEDERKIQEEPPEGYVTKGLISPLAPEDFAIDFDSADEEPGSDNATDEENQGILLPALPGLAGGGEFQTMSTTASLSFCVVTNRGSGTDDVKVRWYHYEVWDDDPTFDDKVVSKTYASGCVTVSNLPVYEDTNNPRDYYVKIFLENADVDTRHVGQFGNFHLDTGSQTWTFRFSSGSGSAAARGFAFVNNGWDYVVNKADVPSSKLNKIWVSTESNGPFANCEDNACYVDGMNEIFISTTKTNSAMTAAHEYGHAFEDMMYLPLLPGGSTHYFCTTYNYEGAWIEGFADYFGARALQTVSQEFVKELPSSSYEWGCGTNSHSIEGTIASILWDLVDSNNEFSGSDSSWDQWDYTDAYVLDVMENCHGHSTGGDDWYHDGLRDFYRGAGGSNCNWLSNGKDKCAFLDAAFENDVDYRTLFHSATATSPSSVTWVTGSTPVTATATTGECSILKVDLALDSSSICSSPDNVQTDASSPYSITASVASYNSGTNLYGCARAHDVITASSWDPSSSYVRVDNTNPTPTVALNGASGSALKSWYNVDVTATLSCYDGHSGVASREFHTGTGAWLPYVFSTNHIAEGSYSYHGRCTDNVNRQTVQSVYFGIDKTKPGTSITVGPTPQTNGWYTSSPTVSFGCSDTRSLCAATEYRYRTNSGTWSNYVAASPKTFGEGTHEIQAYSWDNAGNVGDVVSKTVNVDLQPPNVNVALSGTMGLASWYKTSVQVTITCTDTASPVTISATRDGSAATSSWLETGQGSHSAAATCTDGANRQDSESKPFKIDSRLPETSHVFTGTAGSNNWYTSPVSVSLSCSDGTDNSGCLATTYWLGNVADPGDDTSGNDRDITFVGATTAPGIVGNGVTFDGIDDYLRVDSPGLPTGDFTYMGWVKPVAGEDFHLFMAADGAGGNELILKLLPTHKLGLWIDNVKYDANIAGSTVTANEWSHLAFVRQGSTLRTYVNGVLDASFTGPSTALGFSSCPLLIGTDVDSGCTGNLGNWAQGSADELRIYNRALSTTEIVNAKAHNPPTAGLSGEWLFPITSGGTPTTYSAPFSISAEGTTDVNYYSTDVAGNIESTEMNSVKIDRVAPSSTVSAPAEAKTSNNIFVSWTSADATSGVACVKLEVKTTGAWSTANACGSPVSSNTYVGSPGMTYYFRTQATDVAGNVGAYSPEVSTYVNQPPVANAGPDKSAPFATQYLNGVEVDASGSYDPDGTVVQYCFNWGDGSAVECGTVAKRSHSYQEPTGTPVQSQPYTVTVTVKDNDGRTDSDSARISVPAA